MASVWLDRTALSASVNVVYVNAAAIRRTATKDSTCRTLCHAENLCTPISMIKTGVVLLSLRDLRCVLQPAPARQAGVLGCKARLKRRLLAAV